MIKLKKIKGNNMLKQSLYILACSAILSASTTMCYKKDHVDPSTIESVALDGGKCDGKLSVKDMKKDGYFVDTMKIQNSKSDDGLNYIYIFKKDSLKAVSTTDLKSQLKQIREDKEKQKKIDDTKVSVEKGKKLYEYTCMQCHGKDANEEAYNTSKPLSSLTLDDMKVSIRAYGFDEKDNGMAMIMKPYADSLIFKDIENIYNYIQTLNK